MPATTRFRNGDRVKIRLGEPTPFSGLVAVVKEIEPHPREVALLNRYVVVFDWGEKQPFYEAQLEAAD